MVAVNTGNFLFQLMVARTLDPSAFGAMAALLGLMLVFEVPGNAIQVLVAREVAAVAERRDRTGEESSVPTGALMSRSVLVGAGVCVVFLAAGPLLDSFLRLPNITTAWLVALDVIPIAVACVPKGILLGQQRYRQLAMALVAGTITRLGLGILLVHGGFGIEGAMAAVVGGEIVTAGLLIFAIRRRADDGASTRVIRWRSARGPGAAYTGYWLLTGVDLVVSRHFLGDGPSGLYAAASTTAQIVLILPSAVLSIVIPRLVTGGQRSARRYLMHVMGVVGLAQVTVAALMIIGARPLVRLLFGGIYDSSMSLVVLLTLAGAALGIVATLLQFDVAREIRLPWVLSWFGVLVVVVGTLGWHSSPHDIAVTVIVAAMLVMAGMIVVTLASTGAPDDVTGRAQLALLEADLDLTVVVPYYNPGALLAPNLRRLLEVLDRSGASFEVIAVSDGSTDGSEQTIVDIDDPRLLRVVLAANQGKGAALRIGMARGRGRWLGFLDADGDLDPELLEPFQALMRLYDPEVILGSKRHPLSEIEYPAVRRLYSWGYQRVVHLLFKLNIRDTQTGIKIIRRDVLAAVLPRMVEKRFAFDLELFVIARHLGYKRFFEAPVRLRHQFTSTVSIRSVGRTMRDTLTIFYRLRILRWYDEPVPVQTRAVALRLEAVQLRGAAGRAAPKPDHADA